MTLAEQMRADSAIFFNLAEHGETITYNGVEIVGVVEPGVSRTSGNTWETSEGSSSSGYVWLSQDDVASPLQGDAISLSNGTEWEVARILSTNGGVHQLEIIGNQNPWGVSNARQNRIS